MANLVLNQQHEYFSDGKRVDGLTSTLEEAGLIRNSDPWYAGRGTAVHLATQFYDKGTLDESTVDARIKGYLESWKIFRADHRYVPIEIEFKIYNPILMVATTIDRLPGPLDLKSGAAEKWHILQIALQWETLIATDLRDMIKNPMDVYLDPQGGPPKVRAYKTTELMEAYKVYASMLYFLRWRRENYGDAGGNKP